METNSPWPSAMRTGLILAFVQIIINLVFYMINPDAVETKFTAIGLIQLVITLVASVYVLYSGTIQWRTSGLGGTITYNQSLGYMIKIALPAAFIVGVYTLLFIKFINTGAMEKAMEIQAQQMYDKGMSEEQIDQAMSMAKKMSSPAVVTIMGMFVSMIMFFIYALIASIFTKKNPANENF